MNMNTVGSWSFIVGLILAVIVAIISAAQVPTWAIIVLGVLGIIVGLINITDEEVMPFLTATIAFLISFGALSEILTKVLFNWAAIGSFFSLLTVFIAPAAAIVAIKALFGITRNK